CVHTVSQHPKTAISSADLLSMDWVFQELNVRDSEEHIIFPPLFRGLTIDAPELLRLVMEKYSGLRRIYDAPELFSGDVQAAMNYYKLGASLG
ncbi:hypothetical protein CRM22_000350, partial [Opisthorchis felineus]